MYPNSPTLFNNNRPCRATNDNTIQSTIRNSPAAILSSLKKSINLKSKVTRFLDHRAADRRLFHKELGRRSAQPEYFVAAGLLVVLLLEMDINQPAVKLGGPIIASFTIGVHGASDRIQKVPASQVHPGRNPRPAPLVDQLYIVVLAGIEFVDQGLESAF
jgi:hypothetical protein